MLMVLPNRTDGKHGLGGLRLGVEGRGFKGHHREAIYRGGEARTLQTVPVALVSSTGQSGLGQADAYLLPMGVRLVLYLQNLIPQPLAIEKKYHQDINRYAHGPVLSLPIAPLLFSSKMDCTFYPGTYDK